MTLSKKLAIISLLVITILIVIAILFFTNQKKITTGSILSTSEVLQESKKIIVNDQYGNSSKYEKDGSYIYYDGKIVNNADPVSFEALTIEAGGTMYDGKDNASNYLYGKRITQVLNEKGEPNMWYMSNGENIYFEYGQKVNADVATFMAIGDFKVARDKDNLYVKGKIYNDEDIDRTTLVHLGGVYYGDKNQVHIFSSDPVPNPLPVFDRQSFIILGDTCYAKDKNSIYWCGEVVSDADIQSFVIEEGKTELGDWYNAKDKNRKYANGKTVSSDVMTSEPIIIKDINEKPFFAKNIDSVWIQGEMPPDLILIPTADPETFSPLVYPYSKDANSVFWWTEPIPMTDVNTFKVIESVNGIDSYYASDKNRVYFRSVPVQGADPLTFQTHNYYNDDYYFSYDAQDKQNKYFKGKVVN